MKLLPPSKIYIADSGIKKAGRGVFARDEISKGELIESCPVLFLSKEDYKLAKQTELHNYCFLNKAENRAAVALGYGSIYNHSYEPNATYKKRLKAGFVDFFAIYNIEAGTEITVNYWYGDPDQKKKLWIKEIPAYEG